MSTQSRLAHQEQQETIHNYAWINVFQNLPPHLQGTKSSDRFEFLSQLYLSFLSLSLSHSSAFVELL